MSVESKVRAFGWGSEKQSSVAIRHQHISSVSSYDAMKQHRTNTHSLSSNVLTKEASAIDTDDRHR